MAQDVPHVVVAKQERGAIVATDRVVPENVHFGVARLARRVGDRTKGRLREQGDSEPKLQRCAELHRGQRETKTGDGRCE